MWPFIYIIRILLAVLRVYGKLIGLSGIKFKPPCHGVCSHSSLLRHPEWVIHQWFTCIVCMGQNFTSLELALTLTSTIDVEEAHPPIHIIWKTVHIIGSDPILYYIILYYIILYYIILYYTILYYFFLYYIILYYIILYYIVNILRYILCIYIVIYIYIV
jgi:hypothetical protein